MARLLLLTSLVYLCLGSGRDPRLDEVSRSSFTKYPSCFIGANEDTAKVRIAEESEGGCVVTNDDDVGKLVRVMCGGWPGNKDSEKDVKKGDFDVMTYQYIDPHRKALLLDGRCNSGHRCRICGATDSSKVPGSSSQSQHYLEHQNYECRRRCQVVLYKHEDFNGEAQTFSHNSPDLTKSFLHGKISSLKILGDECEVSLYENTYYRDKLNNSRASCVFTSQKGVAELAIDMAKVQHDCKCHDCVTSMAIREAKTCTPLASGSSKPPKCPKCTGEETDPLSCCQTEHKHSVVDRAAALQRMFKAMAAVLES